LTAAFGPAPAPPSKDPLELVLWENVAYLVDDEQRARAFAALKKEIGVRPDAILKASKGALGRVAELGGIFAEQRIEKLRDIARTTVEEFGGDLRALLKKPLREARKGLKQYPGIGDPGADKILLFAGAAPLLALESNGLRALVRLGFGTEKKSYSSTYREVIRAAEPEAPKDVPGLVALHQLLRRHGQEICRRSDPECERCPLARECPYFARGRR
jgi:endonuclease III